MTHKIKIDNLGHTLLTSGWRRLKRVVFTVWMTLVMWGSVLCLSLSAGDSPIPKTHGPTSDQVVSFNSSEKPGAIVISNSERFLYFILTGNQAIRYRISIGRKDFVWRGTVYVGRKTKWPEWRPTPRMRGADRSLPAVVPAGPLNPLGARAIYLFKSKRDTLFRIHGTNVSDLVGTAQTAGCFRLSNADIINLFERVRTGARVVVR